MRGFLKASQYGNGCGEILISSLLILSSLAMMRAAKLSSCEHLHFVVFISSTIYKTGIQYCLLTF